MLVPLVCRGAKESNLSHNHQHGSVNPCYAKSRTLHQQALDADDACLLDLLQYFLLNLQLPAASEQVATMFADHMHKLTSLLDIMPR